MSKLDTFLVIYSILTTLIVIGLSLLGDFDSKEEVAPKPEVDFTKELEEHQKFKRALGEIMQTTDAYHGFHSSEFKALGAIAREALK